MSVQPLIWYLGQLKDLSSRAIDLDLSILKRRRRKESCAKLKITSLVPRPNTLKSIITLYMADHIWGTEMYSRVLLIISHSLELYKFANFVNIRLIIKNE